MNLSCEFPADIRSVSRPIAYQSGHASARHAAAELALSAMARKDAEIERLKGDRGQLRYILRAFLARYENPVVDASVLFSDIAEMARTELAKCDGERALAATE